MARLAVFASGTGSNFVALADALAAHAPGAPARHALPLLVCDVEGAPVLDRARERGIPALLVSYAGTTRRTVEEGMVRELAALRVDMVALAGFMKLLTPWFLGAFRGPIVNLHPSLLPRHPGAHAIDESWAAGDAELGISIIRVDEGVDTGPVLRQRSFRRAAGETRASAEARIHALEHEEFPRLVIEMLDRIDREGAQA